MLKPETVQAVLEAALPGADLAELYVERWRKRSLKLIDRAVKEANSAIEYGAGLRLFYGEDVVYAYTNDLEETALVALAETLRRLKGEGGRVDARGGGGLDLRVTFRGERADTLSTAQRIERGMAVVPENRRIFPKMTVLENLEMGAFLRDDKRAIREDLDYVFDLFPRLKERLAQKGGTMSGGEQQMLAMGRALMSRPKLILMDEPSMGLAPLFVERIFEIIKQVNERGISVFVVEQNANVALSIADRGYVLQTGEVVLSGPARELLDNEAMKRAYLGEV